MFGKQPRNTFKIPSLQDIKDIGGFVKDYGSEVGSIVSETSKDMGSIIKKHANEKSLILIDEIEMGLHPKVQRRLMDVIRDISRNEKKQFIITLKLVIKIG